MRVLNSAPNRNLAIKAASGMACLVLLAGSNGAHAQEFSLFGGGSRAGNTNTYTWAINYQEGLGQYFAASFTWLNEGHIPDHHRDGQMIQLWGRIPVGNPQFVLQAGVGPYRYFDTTTAVQGGSYSDTTAGVSCIACARRTTRRAGGSRNCS
jgi:hypothetical protein